MPADYTEDEALEACRLILALARASRGYVDQDYHGATRATADAVANLALWNAKVKARQALSTGPSVR